MLVGKVRSRICGKSETSAGNKLRMYRTFMNTYSTEPYLCIITHKKV